MFIALSEGMSHLRVIFALILIFSMAHAGYTLASPRKSYETILKIRAGEHPDYLRLVLEGPDSLISSGKVEQHGKEIIASFAGSGLTVKTDTVLVSFTVDKNSIVFVPRKIRSFMTFYLKNPSRLVIDIYTKKRVQKKTVGKTELSEVVNYTKKNEPKNGVKVTKKDKENETEKNAADEIKKDIKIQMMEQEKRDGETREKTASRTNDPDEIYIPEQYRGLWSLLQSGNFYAVLKELPNFKPEDTKSLAIYHYMYGDAFRTAQQYLDAVKHLRLTYIYAEDRVLKEKALFERAEIYQKLGLIYETRANYLVFLKEFPSSERISEAYLGVADSLSDLNLYDEAVEYYKKAGRRPEILFSKANALQITGRVSEARKAYAEALKIDKKYPTRSAETYFYIGENMRMLGEFDEAKKHFRSLSFNEYDEKARLSLGLIAMEEKNFDEAVRNFKESSRSRNRVTRVNGLFNLGKAYAGVNNFKDAISSFEAIRNNYINSALYKSTLLELSRLYRKQGELRQSISLLKELVYGKQPPKEAFEELEIVVTDVIKKSGDGNEDDLKFTTVWREVGKWMVKASREEFLIKVCEKLRYEGRPFIDLATWIVNSTSSSAKVKAAAYLADYYSGAGNEEYAQKYFDITTLSLEPDDTVLRVQAGILIAKGEHEKAFERIKAIKKFKNEDFRKMEDIIRAKGAKSPEQRLEAAAFYQKMLESGDRDAASYTFFADLLYLDGEHVRSVKYYKVAHEKKPDDEWTAYRLGKGTGLSEAKKMFSRVGEGNTVISRLAKTKLLEINLLDKVEEVY
jgi:tetratricopeptide (TPR) repeat protein